MAPPSAQPVSMAKRGEEKGAEQVVEKDKLVPYLSLFRDATRSDKVLLAVGILGALGTGAARPSTSILFGNVVDGYAAGGDVMGLIRQQCIYCAPLRHSQVLLLRAPHALADCYIALATTACGYAQGYAFTVVSERLTNSIRRKFLAALLHSEIGFFDSESTGALVSRLATDTAMVQNAVGLKVGLFVQIMATFVAGIVIGLARGWQLALVMIGMVPIIGFAGLRSAREGAKAAAEEAEADARAAAFMSEQFGAVRTVASYTGEARGKAAYGTLLTAIGKTNLSRRVTKGTGSGTVQLLLFGTYSLVLWFGSWLIRHGVMTGGRVINVFFAVMQAGASIGQTATSVDAFARGRGAATTLFATIDRQPRLGDPPGGGIVLGKDARGELGFEAVTFCYPARPTAPVFTSLTLSLPAGRMTALVGESGSGKSSVVQLLLRFYDPDGGRVTFDGVDLRSLRLSSLRSKIGLVGQEPVLFAASLAENLRYGKPDASDEELAQAVEAAHATEFVARLPQGLHTHTGDRGGQLSGGQKQRIAIARAILKDPAVLLLDEATSALDSESEKAVQVALDAIRRASGRTTVAVAHRLSTIRDADRIVVLRLGAVVEAGSHDELASRPGGAYAALLALQEGATREEQDARVERERAAARAAGGGGGAPQPPQQPGSGGSGGGASPPSSPAAASAAASAPASQAPSLLRTASGAVASLLGRAASGGGITGGGAAQSPKSSGRRSGSFSGSFRRGGGSVDGGKRAPPPAAVAPAPSFASPSFATFVGTPGYRLAAAVATTLADGEARLADDVVARLATADVDASTPRGDAVLASVEVHSSVGGGSGGGSKDNGGGDAAAHDAKAAPGGCGGDDDAMAGTPVDPRPLRRLAGWFAPEAGWFITGSVAAALCGAVFPVFALILSRLLTVFYLPAHEMAPKAEFWALMFFMLGCASFIIYTAAAVCGGVMAQRVGTRVRAAALSAALRQEVSFFEDRANASGALANRLAADAQTLRLLVSDGVYASLQNGATFVAGIAIAFAGGWQLALVMCGTVPLTGAAFYLSAKKLGALAGDTRKLYEGATQVASDAVANVRTVAAFGAEDRVMASFEVALQAPAASAEAAAVTSGFSQAFAQAMTSLPTAFVFYVGAIYIQHHILTFEQVMQVFLALTMAVVGMSQVSASSGAVGDAGPAASALLRLVDRAPRIDSSDEGGLRPGAVAGAMELRGVVFSYPARRGEPALDGLTLALPAGRTTALVGESGSGKSTVIQLLLRFYDPQRGVVFLDNTDIRQLNVAWLRRHLGLVSQEPALFQSSVFDNVAYGEEGASREEVDAALAAAHAAGFVGALPSGVDTQVGERGISLSGGQKQRVAIARAFLKNAPVLLLDEATSALDAESERAVQDALSRLMVGRTCVVVAHRLSTIRSAHSIAVLGGGKLLEQGSHEALIARPGGKYATLVQLRSVADDE